MTTTKSTGAANRQTVFVVSTSPDGRDDVRPFAEPGRTCLATALAVSWATSPANTRRSLRSVR